MEAIHNYYTLLSTPLPTITNEQINALNDGHLRDFCKEKKILSAEGDTRDILIGRIMELRDNAATGKSTAATANNDEFDEYDDEEFASFDMDAAIKGSSLRMENMHPNHDMSQTNAAAVPNNTPAKRMADPPTEGSNEKRYKTPECEEDAQDCELSPNETLEIDEEIPPQFTSSMTNSLSTYFKYNTFRPGQLTIIHSVLNNRDACAFWATGAGKSLTYQLPPLHLHQVGVVVTPLVSLMMDQVSKLNASQGKEVAAFLGSSQKDQSVENRVFEGEFRLVYVTPEKLVGGIFLERLQRMHLGGGKGRVCVFAVDESHCVSEWGHDFRPEFLKIGASIRSQSAFSSVPILALTATAVPRVQSDILKNLHMKMENTTIVKKSFDRPNLKIIIKRKPKTGTMAALDVIVQELFKAEGRNTAKSTIVYCATRREVESVSTELINAFAHRLADNKGVAWEEAISVANQRIKPYHAGLSTRQDAHFSFLVGKTPVIVATVAFGMGIDKPDIRRVVHWGPPKTVEEYYQQMGRASRDGLFGECIMYCDLQDFAKYKSGFYLKDLKGDALAATQKSMDALRDFCMSDDCCRRASLMSFFEEVPSFGKWCGTCDICSYREVNGDELERDFAFDGARVLLGAVVLCNGQAWSTIEKVINGSEVESYKYSSRSYDNIRLMKTFIAQEKKKMKKKRSMVYLKELINPLIKYGVLTEELKQSKYSRGTFVVYKVVSSKTVTALSKNKPIVLPVPQYIREIELAEAEKRKKALEELEKKGVDLQHIPKEEIEAGEGDAIAAFNHWFSYMERLEQSGRTEFVNQMDDLKARVVAWRLDTAERLRIAPTSVMEEHLLFKVAYATATLPPGQLMAKESLAAAGVRDNGIEELTKVLAEWTETVKESRKGDVDSDKDAQDVPMSFKPGEKVTPQRPWAYSVYRPMKKTGKANWEVSYDRFKKGEHPQTIAMKQQSGKPIQVATVIGHLLEALQQGRPVNVQKLASFAEPPTKSQWEQLAGCEQETGIDVTKDPATSGKNGEKFAMRDFLSPIMGPTFTAKDYKERTPEESAKWGQWINNLNWYLAFRRVRFTPRFESPQA